MYLKQAITIIIITAFAMQTFNRYVVLIDYKINTQAFAKNCINKAKPNMHCNGKCQMMKKILEQENKEKKSPEKKGIEHFFSICSKSYFLTTITPQKFLLKKQYLSFNSTKQVKRTYEIFHPPCLTPSFC